MQRTLKVVLSLILILSLVSLTAFAQKKDPAPAPAKTQVKEPAKEPTMGGQPSPEDMQKMMAEFMKMGAPGPQHELLKKLTGDCIANSKMWMDAASDPMTTPPGTHTGEMILGGRFLKVSETGDMMGMPMEGMGLMGYNKLRNVYQMLWIDNTATAFYFGEGTADSTGKALTLVGKVDDPMTGDKDKPVKYIYRFADNKPVVFEMWDTGKDGKFFKSMETTYTKK